MKPINTLCGKKNTKLFIVEAGGIFNCQWALKCADFVCVEMVGPNLTVWHQHLFCNC
jgi:hypothetical protein